MKIGSIVLIGLVLITGCAKKSNLIIYNDSGVLNEVKVDGGIYTMTGNSEPINIEYYLNNFLLFNEKKEIPIEIVGTTFVQPRKFKITMKAGQDKIYRIVKNRAVIKLFNLAEETIAKVYFRKNDSNNWSNNYLDGFLFQEESIDIIVDKMYEWIKIVDMYETEFPEQEISFTPGEYTEFYFTGKD